MIVKLMSSGTKQWTDTRSARTSLSSLLTHDPAFLRLQPGVYALKALVSDEVVVVVVFVWWWWCL